eukprot:3346976-Rhodomonas_salina.1
MEPGGCAYAPFPEKCNPLSYSQRGRFHLCHWDYWMLKMWLGEPHFNNPGFMPGVIYHHIFDVDKEEVLHKVAGGEALTAGVPASSLEASQTRQHFLGRRKSSFYSGTGQQMQPLKLNPSPSVGAPCLSALGLFGS